MLALRKEQREMMVSKFQNEFMKSSFLQKYEQKNVKICALTTQGRNPDNFLFVLWRNNDFINSFWNLLTFRQNSSLTAKIYLLINIRLCGSYN